MASSKQLEKVGDRIDGCRIIDYSLGGTSEKKTLVKHAGPALGSSTPKRLFHVHHGGQSQTDASSSSQTADS